MKTEDRDLLVSCCAKVACKAGKITSYVIVYQTKNGVIHTQRGGSATQQIGLVKLAKGNIVRGFE